MGKPVRLRSFDEDGVNIALQQLSGQIRDLAPKAKTGVDMAAIEAVRNYVNDILAKLDGLVPVARTVNGFPLAEDVTLTSDDIEFSGLGRSVTERIEEIQVPINIRGSVQNIADLPMTGILPNDGFVVLTDETHGNQPWLYVWADWGSGLGWNAVAPFGVDLSNYYTRDETWSGVRIIADQQRQDENTLEMLNARENSIMGRVDTITDVKIAANNIAVNNGIGNARRDAMAHADRISAGLRNEMVPNSRRVNGWPLMNDVVLSAMDIEFLDGQSVWSKLNALGSAISLQYVVDAIDDLPPPFRNGTGAIVRRGPSGNPEMWVIIDGAWEYAASFAINLDIFYTRPEVRNLIDLESGRAQAAELQLRADMESEAHNTLILAENYIDYRLNVVQGIFDAKVDESFPVPLVTGLVPYANDVAAGLTVRRIWLDGNDGPSEDVPLPRASAERAGIINSASYARLWQMSEWIDNFQIGGTYIDSFPTRAALNAAPHQAWWEPNDWAIVQADETSLDGFGSPQVTRYVLNAGLVWTFANVFGGNMPGLFSNIRAGLIRGTAAGDGTIGLLDPATGTAGVNGWDALAGMVRTVSTEVGIGPDGSFTNPTTGLNRRVTNAESGITGLRGSVQENVNDISSLRGRMTTAEGTIGGHTTSIAANTGAVASLRTEISNVADGLAGKVDRIDQPGITGAVMVDYNDQGQIVNSSRYMPWERITGFNEAVDARVPTPPAGANLSSQQANFGQSAQDGTAGTFARSDHFHALPTAPDVSGLGTRITNIEARQGTANMGFTTGTSLNVAAASCRNVVIFSVNSPSNVFNISFAAGTYNLLMFRGTVSNTAGDINIFNTSASRVGLVGSTAVNIGPGLQTEVAPGAFVARGLVYAFRA